MVGGALGIAPAPADRDTGIGEVEDVAVCDGGVRGMADPDTDRRRMYPAAVRDRAVADHVARDGSLRIGEYRRGAHEHAAGGEIDQLAPRKRALLAAVAQFECVAADVPHATAVEGNVPCSSGTDDRADVHLRLRIRLTARRQVPVSVGEREPLEPNVLDELSRGHLAAEFDQPVEHRRYDRDGFGRLARPWAIGERAGRPVEVPRTGEPERLPNILHQKAVSLGEGAPVGRAPRVSGERDRLLRVVILQAVDRGDRIDRGDRQAGHRPPVDGHHLHVAEVRPVGPQVVTGKDDSVVPLVGIGRRWRQCIGDRVPAGGGQHRSKPALVVHKQLRKVPRPRLHLREHGRPTGLFLRRLLRYGPPGDDPAATQQRPGPIGRVNHRRRSGRA